jgi:thymidylate synthase (FAD)
MAHCTSPEAEKILDRKFKVLDKGFVRLVDYLGADARIVQAARVSYGNGTKTFREDKGLINYLLRNDHTSPFEQVVFTFHVKLPIFVARQWIRHRTARVNEISGRYSVMKPEFYLPSAPDIAFQSENNKQGRAPTVVPTKIRKRVLSILDKDQKDLYDKYTKLLEFNIARELARINLPLSLYTEWYWQIDLHNLFHFLALRLDPHAQMEIRAYAGIINKIGRTVCPVAFDAFDEHILSGVRLSSSEINALREILKGRPAGLDEKSHTRLMSKLRIDTAVKIPIK